MRTLRDTHNRKDLGEGIGGEDAPLQRRHFPGYAVRLTLYMREGAIKLFLQHSISTGDRDTNIAQILGTSTRNVQIWV